MRSNRLFKRIGLAIMGSLISVSAFAGDSTEVVENKVVKAPVVVDADIGRQYFEGSKAFAKGGPACITCHNVTNDKLIPGGLLAKDLTAIYPKYGPALPSWLDNPDNAPMTSSYQHHKLDSAERLNVAAFLEHANKVKKDQTKQSGTMLFVFGGGAGLAVILILISLLFMKRKKQMVKKDIFARQNSAWDAKH